MKELWRSGSNELWGECLAANANEDTASVDSDGEHLLSVASQHPKDLHEYQLLFPASYRGLLRASASYNLHRPSPSPHNWKAPWLPVCRFIYQGSGDCTAGKFRNCILFCFIFTCWCVCVCAPQHGGARVDIRGQLFESVHSFLPFLYVRLELNSRCHVHPVPLPTEPSCLPW